VQFGAVLFAVQRVGVILAVWCSVFSATCGVVFFSGSLKKKKKKKEVLK
jgi:hypothetical protein